MMSTLYNTDDLLGMYCTFVRHRQNMRMWASRARAHRLQKQEF